MKFTEVAFSVLITFLQKILIRTATGLWDELWEIIFEAVVEAEEKWGGENGSKKKEWAMDKIMSFIKENAELNFIQRFIAEMIVGNVVDAIIEEFNEQVGHDWLETAKEVKEKIGAMIPIIES